MICQITLNGIEQVYFAFQKCRSAVAAALQHHHLCLLILSDGNAADVVIML